MWRICIGIVSSLPGSGLRQTIEGAESCRVRSRFVPSLDGAVWPRSLLILRSLPLQMLNMPADDSSSGNAWNEEVWAMTLQNAGVHMIIKTMAAKTSEMEVLRRRPEDPKGIWYRLWMCISCSRRRTAISEEFCPILWCESDSVYFPWPSHLGGFLPAGHWAVSVEMTRRIQKEIQPSFDPKARVHGWSPF